MANSCKTYPETRASKSTKEPLFLIRSATTSVCPGSQSVSSLFIDAETSQKRFEVEFAPKGQKGCDIEFDGWNFSGIGKAKTYDKKTGEKCVKEVSFLGEGRKMEVLYGEGASKTRIITDADGHIQLYSHVIPGLFSIYWKSFFCK